MNAVTFLIRCNAAPTKFDELVPDDAVPKKVYVYLQFLAMPRTICPVNANKGGWNVLAERGGIVRKRETTGRKVKGKVEAAGRDGRDREA